MDELNVSDERGAFLGLAIAGYDGEYGCVFIVSGR